jgi:hypothetical protein
MEDNREVYNKNCDKGCTDLKPKHKRMWKFYATNLYQYDLTDSSWEGTNSFTTWNSTFNPMHWFSWTWFVA